MEFKVIGAALLNIKGRPLSLIFTKFSERDLASIALFYRTARTLAMALVNVCETVTAFGDPCLKS